MSPSVQLNTLVRGELRHSLQDERWATYVPAMVMTFEPETRCVRFLNSKVSECLGYTTQELAVAGIGLSNLLHPDDAGNFESFLASLASMPDAHAQTTTVRFRQKSGGTRHVKTCCTKAEEYIVIVGEDVTDRIRVEEEAASTRMLFDETEKLLLFGSWSWSLETDTLACTEGFYQLLDHGENAREITHLNQFVNYIVPEHAEHVQQVLHDANTTGQAFECEFILRTATGREKVVLMKVKPLFDQAGAVRKLIGTARDITAKKNSENERDRNIRELNRSNKELEEFAYVASHDLHEPLRKVLTFSERLKGKFSSALGEDGKIYLDRIWASADSMRNLIDNLLEFSRISRGNRSFVHCDLNEVLKQVQSDQELRIEETSTVLNIERLPVIEAVPAELKQLFNNLIGNALKFRKKDIKPSINIACRKLSHREKSELLLPFNQVFYRIDVADNGIGFEEVYAEKIFEIFQRLHGKTEYSGSGIGLAICKKIAENHDGLIFATGEPGKGATFSLILPEKQH